MLNPRLALLCLLSPALALAQSNIYICKDAAGRTLSSDRPIAECSTQPMRVMDNSGITRREIAAPLTPEEKRKNEQETRARRAEELAVVERRRNDTAILARYHSEDDIIGVGRSNAAIVQENVKRETQVLAVAEKRQQAAEADLAKLTGKNVRPAYLQQRLEEADRAVNGSRRRLDDYEAEILLINTRTEMTLTRFRELRQQRTGQ